MIKISLTCESHQKKSLMTVNSTDLFRHHQIALIENRYVFPDKNHARMYFINMNS